MTLHVTKIKRLRFLQDQDLLRLEFGANDQKWPTYVHFCPPCFCTLLEEISKRISLYTYLKKKMGRIFFYCYTHQKKNVFFVKSDVLCCLLMIPINFDKSAISFPPNINPAFHNELKLRKKCVIWKVTAIPLLNDFFKKSILSFDSNRALSSQIIGFSLF